MSGRRLWLIGAGGHGKVAADAAEACGWREIAFLDGAFPGKTANGRWKVIGPPDLAGEAARFCTVGRNDARERLFQELGLEEAPILAHPSAVLSPSARLGAGTLAVAGAIVNADAVIGRGVILNTGCSVDHDCRIEDFAHISPGARLAGGVSVGRRSWIGVGAVVREGVRIGADVVVGAGAAVIRDVPDGARVGGVPARPLSGG